jgi:hypothetical protein
MQQKVQPKISMVTGCNVRKIAVVAILPFSHPHLSARVINLLTLQFPAAHIIVPFGNS